MSIRQGELPNVWVMDADGTNAIQLTSDETADHKPAWFPDSRRVAYMTKRGTVGGLWSVDIQTRREELVFDFAGAETPSDARRTAGRVSAVAVDDADRVFDDDAAVGPPGAVCRHRQALRAARGGLADTSRRATPRGRRMKRMLAVEIKDGGSTQAGVVDLKSGALAAAHPRARADLGAKLVA